MRRSSLTVSMKKPAELTKRIGKSMSDFEGEIKAILKKKKIKKKKEATFSHRESSFFFFFFCQSKRRSATGVSEMDFSRVNPMLRDGSYE